MKILIVKPSSLGDIIHGLFAAAVLRRAVPSAEIWWVVNDSLAAIVALCPGIHVIPFPRKALGHASLRHLREFLGCLRTERFDAVLDMQGLLRSALIGRAARAKLRYGFANAREGAPFFYTDAVTVPPEIRHAADKNRYLVEAFLKDRGLAVPAVERSVPVEIPESWREEASALREANGLSGRLLLAVGCSSRWPSKSWPEEFFADVLRRVAAVRPDVGIWLLGAPEEQCRSQHVKELCRLDNVVNLAGRTSMGALCALLRESSALFTNDSGPMHIAALLGVPCIANFGSTDPALTGPYGEEGRHFLVQSLCGQSPCFQRECPRGDNALCCHGVDRRTVAEAILKRLSK